MNVARVQGVEGKMEGGRKGKKRRGWRGRKYSY